MICNYLLPSRLTQYLCFFLCGSCARIDHVGSSVLFQSEKTRLYPAPAGEVSSKDYSFMVNGAAAFVYEARVAKQTAWPVSMVENPPYNVAAFAYFDFEGGSVDLRVNTFADINTVKIRPLSLGIVPRISGRQLEFSLSQPANLTIEINGNEERVFHVFANPIEASSIAPNDPNVIYFGPGVHKVASLFPASGKTVYIAGGAIVRGIDGGGAVGPAMIETQNAHKVKIRGRGILDGGLLPWHQRQMIHIGSSSEIDIEGIILRDAPSWTVMLSKSNNVRVNNIKQLSYRFNSDGIDICNSNDVIVKNSFIRNRDDSITVKTLEPNLPSRRIRVENNVVWNDWGYGLGITYENRAPIEDVSFRGNTVIHATQANPNFMSAIGIVIGDSGLVHNVTFENTTVERTKSPAVGISIRQTPWSRDGQLGNVDGVVFHDLRLLGSILPRSFIYGASVSAAVTNVRFEGVEHAGRRIGSLRDAGFEIGSHVSAVDFE